MRAPAMATPAKPGDLVEVWGHTANVGFVTMVAATEMRRLGTAPIGPSLKPTFDQAQRRRHSLIARRSRKSMRIAG